MISFPYVVAPNMIVGETRSGIAIKLLSVELWETRLVIRLGAIEDGETAAAELEFRTALSIWDRQGGGKRPPAPDFALMGADAMPVIVAADNGEGYDFGAAQVGGDHRAWSAEWIFEPGVSDAVRRLTVSVGGVGEVTVELAAEHPAR
jgi:hypothetical protein